MKIEISEDYDSIIDSLRTYQLRFVIVLGNFLMKSVNCFQFFLNNKFLSHSNERFLNSWNIVEKPLDYFFNSVTQCSV